MVCADKSFSKSISGILVGRHAYIVSPKRFYRAAEKFGMNEKYYNTTYLLIFILKTQ
jgi:hypothetical protein